MTRWVLLAAVTVVATLGAEHVGIPSAALFVALFVATGFALAGLGPAGVPRQAAMTAQAVLGVEIGTLLQRDTLSGLGSGWIAVVLVCLGTLLLSLAAGATLGLHRDVDHLTGALALVAGGASGLVAITQELGGDERVVAVVQYLRVLLVTASLPLVATVVFSADTSAGPSVTTSTGSAPWYGDIAFVAVCAAAGIALARLGRLPAPALLGPLIISAAADLMGFGFGTAVPTALLTVAYFVIGWQAGLRFTVASLRSIGRVLPWALLLIIAIAVGCALLGLLLVQTTSITPYEAYLATTPGGVYAVLAIAAATGVNVTFVVAAQIVRVFMMLFAVPVGARIYQNRHPRAH